MKKLILIMVITLMIGSLKADDLKMVTRMYDSGKARSIGDLVTIIISETSSSSKAESLSTSKSANFNGTAPIFPAGIEGDSKLGAFRLLNDYATLKGLNISSGSTFDGGGSASTTENLSAQITARVVDVLPNGNVVVKGERRVKMKQEEIHLIMTGMLRVRDISKTNTINSSLMSDAHIYYETSGNVTDGTQPGLLWRIFQFINPF